MLVVRYVFEHSLRGERSPRLLRYLLAHGADEFSVAVLTLEGTPAPLADKFEDEFRPYGRPADRRRVITNADWSDLGREVRLWTFNDASLQRLLGFFSGGLFHSPAGPDGWLEDLTIYRETELLVGLVSHEQEGVLRLTHQEHVEVAALDIPSEPTAEWIGY
jgi:hypothetical protein